ncbi:MAG: hypothetical protein U9N60_01215 [Thermodesulfobacteriota bacterium]|nr:hypothetical protein [Thermodesulfobacteriota bacterium]
MTEILEIEQVVIDLKKVVPFKKVTSEGDIVLIVTDKPRTIVYALIWTIVRDKAKRGEWWHVTMHALTIPPQQITWTLRTPQFSGEEIFTMKGDKRFMQAVNLKKTVSGLQLGLDKKVLKPKRKATLRVVK